MERFNCAIPCGEGGTPPGVPHQKKNPTGMCHWISQMLPQIREDFKENCGTYPPASTGCVNRELLWSLSYKDSHTSMHPLPKEL